VSFFRRKEETLHEQLLREAGLDSAQALADTPSPESLEPPQSESATDEWEAVTIADGPYLVGRWVEFITLPNGDLIVDRDVGNADLSPLADAVEELLSPPYRAVATHQGGLWGLKAKPIQVAEFPFARGARLELARRFGHDEFRVDDKPSDEAARIEGDFWELRVSAL
jgi:hypothetical protein